MPVREGAFTLCHTDDGHYVFGWINRALSRVCGRALRDHDFLSLWSYEDRARVCDLLGGVRLFAVPRRVHIIAKTYGGEEVPYTLTFSKLNHARWFGRYVGCQWQAQQQTQLKNQFTTPIKGLALA